MAAELNKAQIIISPMQSGYGMHIKLLEAMATAVPVVSTRMGLGAIKATHGLNILIAENPLILRITVSLYLMIMNYLRK
jgi:glycosyltransferase involved in cell wall biosynthesis